MYDFTNPGGVLATLGEYLLASFMGLIVGCIVILVVRNTRAAWTWVLLVPTLIIIGGPTVHASGSMLFGGFLATGITLLWAAFKHESKASEIGLRDALANARARIIASLVVVICAVAAIADGKFGTLIITVVMLTMMWWNYGARELIHELTRSGGSGRDS